MLALHRRFFQESLLSVVRQQKKQDAFTPRLPTTTVLHCDHARLLDRGLWHSSWKHGDKNRPEIACALKEVSCCSGTGKVPDNWIWEKEISFIV